MHTKQTCFLGLWDGCYENYNELWQYHFQLVQNGTKPSLTRTTLLLKLRFQPSVIKGKQDVVCSCVCWAVLSDSPWLINILLLGKCAYIKQHHNSKNSLTACRSNWCTPVLKSNKRRRLFNWTVWKPGWEWFPATYKLNNYTIINVCACSLKYKNVQLVLIFWTTVWGLMKFLC